MTGSKWGALAVAAALGAAVMAFAPSAAAEPTTQEKEHARDLMADGRDKRDNKSDFAGALTSFEQADAIMHVPTTAFEVAKTQQLLGQLLEAQATCAAIASHPPEKNEPAPFAEARQKADALSKDLEKQTPKLTITVKSASPASVTLDGNALSTLDEVRLNPGTHVIAAHTDEGDARQALKLAVGDTKTIELKIEPKVVAAAPPPPKASALKKVPTLSWAGFGVGAVGLVVGGVTGAIAISDESDISNRCPKNQCTHAVSSDLSSAKTIATVSTIGFIVAGVGVAVGVVGLFVMKPKTEEAAPAPTAKLGPITFDPTTLRGTF